MPIDLSLSYENRFENELLDSSSSQHSRLFATWRSSFLFLITVERKRPVRCGSASLSPEKRLDYRAPARPDYFRIPQKSAIVI